MEPRPPLPSEPGSTTGRSEDHTSGSGSSGRPVRSRRLPVRFRDVLPEPSLPSLPYSEAPSEPSTSTSETRTLPRVILHVFDSLRTSFNKFSIARDYRHRPSYDPDVFLTLDQLSNITHEPAGGSSRTVALDTPSLPPAPPWPWKNMSLWRLMTWMMTGSTQKSSAEVTRLVHEVIRSPDFDHDHFIGFNAHTQMKQFDKSENVPGDSNDHLQQDAWQEQTVNISVPTRERNPDGNGQPFSIPGLFHRPIDRKSVV